MIGDNITMKQTVEERQEQVLARPAAPRKSEQEHLPSVAIAHRGKLIKLIELASRRRAKWDVFRDFVTMASTAFARLDLSQAARREEQYLACMRHYTKDELALFPQMMAQLTLGMEACPRDILGETFMMLDLGNAYRGQFFTPYELCQLVAGVTFSEVNKETIAEQGFITFHEPACGAGAMIIAAMTHLREKGINYQQCVHVTAIDVDSTAAMMTFVQLSLLHVPATIVNGNSLTLQEFDHWHTPAHILDLWGPRLRARDAQVQSKQGTSSENDPEEVHAPR